MKKKMKFKSLDKRIKILLILIPIILIVGFSVYYIPVYNSTYTYYTEYNTELHSIDVNVGMSDYIYYQNALHPSHVNDFDVLGGYCAINLNTINIANEIRNACDPEDEEEVVNALLSFVQADTIRYLTESTDLGKYPVETLIDRGGDCEDLCILYATLLKSINIDCILIYGIVGSGNETYGHVNVGVVLSNAPSHSGIIDIYRSSINIEGINYYLAETTSSGWFVGEKPSEITLNTSVYVIV